MYKTILILAACVTAALGQLIAGDIFSDPLGSYVNLPHQPKVGHTAGSQVTHRVKRLIAKRAPPLVTQALLRVREAREEEAANAREDQPMGFSDATLAGIIIAAVLAVAATIMLSLFVRHYRRDRKGKMRLHSSVGANTAAFGDSTSDLSFKSSEEMQERKSPFADPPKHQETISFPVQRSFLTSPRPGTPTRDVTSPHLSVDIGGAPRQKKNFPQYSPGERPQSSPTHGIEEDKEDSKTPLPRIPIPIIRTRAESNTSIGPDNESDISSASQSDIESDNEVNRSRSTHQRSPVISGVPFGTPSLNRAASDQPQVQQGRLSPRNGPLFRSKSAERMSSLGRRHSRSASADSRRE